MPMPNFDISAALSDAENEEALRRFERMKFWRLYKKQRIFLDLSASAREIALFGGNGAGKTETGAFAVAVWLTGEYPMWWEGRRWRQPLDMWVAGPSGAALRGSTQAKLFGASRADEEGWGSGMIPRRCLGKPTYMRNMPDVIDRIPIRHTSGRWSELEFKTYEQDRANWQGKRLDILWFDEEPPLDLHGEGLARLTGRDGLSLLTFTPMVPGSEVVKRFTDMASASRASASISLSECPHISPEELANKREQYPEREWPARIDGNPLYGGGLVFRTPEEALVCDLRISAIPLHWKKLWGVDFGIGHPFAAALLAYDPDLEISYILHTIRMPGATRLEHAAAIRRIASNLPVAWPRDGFNRVDSEDELVALKDLYKRHGLLMLHTYAQDARGSNALYAAVDAWDQEMRLGKFRVGRQCREWFEEYRRYHYDENGKIVAKDEDILSAARYAWMMRRFGITGAIGAAQAPWVPDMRPKRAKRSDIPGWVY